MEETRVGGSYFENTVDIDFEGHFDLWNTSWRGWNAGEIEFAENVIVLGHRSFTLEHLNGHGGLILSGRRKDLTLLRRDDSVSRNDLGHHTTDGFNTHGQRIDIEQDDVTRVLFA